MATVHPESYLVILNTFHKHDGKRKHLYCKVLCTACGREKDVLKTNIFGVGKGGGIKSCGCMKEKFIFESRFRVTPPGSTDHPLYRTWVGMRDRCCNPNSVAYKSYGARGITMHSDWKDDFPAFVAWVDSNLGARPEGHTIDRINNDLGYQPGNLRWADARTQQNNRRCNVNVTHNGQTMTISQWASALGIKRVSLYSRYQRGLTPETGLFEPPKKKSRNVP